MSTTAVSEYTAAIAAADAEFLTFADTKRTYTSELVKVRAELVKVQAELDKVVALYKDYRSTNRAKVEKRRIQNGKVFQDWMEHKIAAIDNFDDEDSITLTLPYAQGDLSADTDYPDYIHFLKDMEEEGEGSDNVFSVSGSTDDWFVKSVESEVFQLYQNGKDAPCTHFKVTVEKVITYECMCCSDFHVRGGMMSNGDDYLCEDCHSSFETMG